MKTEFITTVNKLEDEGNVTELGKLEVSLMKEIKVKSTEELVRRLNYVRDAVSTILFFKP